MLQQIITRPTMQKESLEEMKEEHRERKNIQGKVKLSEIIKLQRQQLENNIDKVRTEFVKFIKD